jgi:iron complex outermembrane recepter protein
MAAKEPDMKLSIAVALIALIPALASAQAPTSATPADACRPDSRKPKVALSGTVTDQTGASIGSATVTLRCGAYKVIEHTHTDGLYKFTVPAGSYQVDVDAQGFEPTAETVDLQASNPQKRDFTLNVGGFESIVNVTAEGGFVATSSTTATKTGAPLIEIAQTVSVVTLDQMLARNVQTVNEAIRYTGSVNVDAYGADPRYDWLMIRGFDQSNYGLYRDSSRWQAGTLTGQVDAYLLQEVDVVKGPSSVLFGQNTPGGLVNLVTKRPPKDAINELAVNYGSFERKQIQGDFGGPIDKAGHWRYRLTGLYRDSDTQVQYTPDNRVMIAPALTWAPSAQTTWTLLADYQHDKTGWGRFLPASGTMYYNEHGKIASDLYTGEPGYDYYKRDQWSVGSLFEHQFNTAWTFRNTFRYSSIDVDGKCIYGAGLEADNRTMDRYAFGTTSKIDLYTTDTHLNYRKKAGGIEHSVLFGVDYSHSKVATVSGFGFGPTLDVFEPTYGLTSDPTLYTYYDQDTPLSLVGVYAQDHIKIARRLVATLSTRYDWTTMTTDDQIAGTTYKQDPTKLSGRVGMTYLSDFGLAPYVSYATSFLPVSGSTYDGDPYKPTEGVQYEGGLKLQPKHSNSFITASAFQITQTNVTVTDPDHALSFVQQGEIRSRGLEFEGVGNVATGLNVHGSYSYIDQEVTKTTDPTTLGNRPPRSPKHLAALTADYTVTSGALIGLGLGGGVRYVGESAGDETNSIWVPSFMLADLSVRYTWNNLEFQLSATNAFDKLYVATCSALAYCNYGNTRNVLGTMRYRWNKW